jgi:hypothetical protein
VPYSIESTLAEDGSVSFCSSLGGEMCADRTEISILIFHKASMTYFAQTVSRQPIILPAVHS